MAGRVTDQSPDDDGRQGASGDRAAGAATRDGRRGRAVERHRAETDVAAGDVADDLADFA